MSQFSEAYADASVQIDYDAWTEPFWRAAAEHRLTACKCGQCGAFRMPPTAFCPICRSQAVEWPQLSGRGTVFSVTYAHAQRASGESYLLIPAVVELEDAPGVRLVGNVVGAEPKDVDIGAPVQIAWQPVADGFSVPVFQLRAT